MKEVEEGREKGHTQLHRHVHESLSLLVEFCIAVDLALPSIPLCSSQGHLREQTALEQFPNMEGEGRWGGRRG